MGGDQPGAGGGRSAIQMFQLTPPRGGRLLRPDRRGGACRFNSRPRVGGDPASQQCEPAQRCFNSRPRVGGDAPEAHAPVDCGVSTHAPAWGATSRRLQQVFDLMFQLTPPRGGATWLGCRRHRDDGGFNSRPRVGGDRQRITCLKQESYPPDIANRIKFDCQRTEGKMTEE